MDLTPKQQRFVEEYLKDLNATAAYRRAGYSAKGNAAESAASRLLRNVKVAAAIQAAQAQRAHSADVDTKQVIQELARVGFADLGGIFDLQGKELRLRPASEWPALMGRAIASLKVRRDMEKKPDGDGFYEVETLEFKLWPKVEALDKLMRHLGLYKDRQPGDSPENPLHVRCVDFTGNSATAAAGDQAS